MARAKRSVSVSASSGRPSVELIYRKGNRWMASAVSLSPKLSWEPPRVVFQTDSIDTDGIAYDITPDGQRLLVVKRTREARTGEAPRRRQLVRRAEAARPDELITLQPSSGPRWLRPQPRRGRSWTRERSATSSRTHPPSSDCHRLDRQECSRSTKGGAPPGSASSWGETERAHALGSTP